MEFIKTTGKNGGRLGFALTGEQRKLEGLVLSVTEVNKGIKKIQYIKNLQYLHIHTLSYIHSHRHNHTHIHTLVDEIIPIADKVVQKHS